MDKTVYVCTGTCAAEISEEEHAGGLTVCGTEGCSMIGKPFEKKVLRGEKGVFFFLKKKKRKRHRTKKLSQ